MPRYNPDRIPDTEWLDIPRPGPKIGPVIEWAEEPEPGPTVGVDVYKDGRLIYTTG